MARLDTTVSRHRAESGRSVRLSVLRFWTDRAGATAIEYGLIAGLTFLVIAGSLKLFAERMTLMYNYIGNSLAGAF